MLDLFDLKNRVVVVTGGLGRIGLATAKEFATRGAKVFVLDVKDKADNDLVGTSIRYRQCDITDEDLLVTIRDNIIKECDRIDVLINSAGIVHNAQTADKSYSFEENDVSDWEKETSVNIIGTMLCCKVFGTVMQLGGSIINFSSVYGIVAPDQRIYHTGYKQPAIYGVTKGAIIAFTRFLATYWGKKGVRVNCLAPGGVGDGDLDKEFVSNYVSKVPLDRMARLEDIIGPLVFLATDASAYCTGTTLVVDGGWTAW